MAPKRKTGTYPCSKCPRIFNRLENLKRHQKSHQGSLPHCCDICQREFSRSDLLKKHQRTHQRQDEQQPTDEPPLGKRRYPFVLENKYGSSSSDTSFTPGDNEPEPRPAVGSNLLGQPSQADLFMNQAVHGAPVLVDGDVDFTGFFRPWDTGKHLDTNDWFTQDFYDASQEMVTIFGPNDFIAPGNQSAYGAAHELWSCLEPPEAMQFNVFGMQSIDSNAQVTPVTSGDVTENSSRAASPPNMPSKEDAIAFAWDPASEGITCSDNFEHHERDIDLSTIGGLKTGPGVFRYNVKGALEYWEQLISRAEKHDPDAWGVNEYFHGASRVLLSLANLNLAISVSNLQDAIGKSGPQGIARGLDLFKRQLGNLPYLYGHENSNIGQVMSRWTLSASVENKYIGLLTVFDQAIRSIHDIISVPTLQQAAPYSIISTFLHYVLLWMLIGTSTKEELCFLRCLLDKQDELLFTTAVQIKLRNILEMALGDGTGGSPRAEVIFRHASQELTRLGTWGASLNLALLLRLRASQ
ncbi:Transcription factor steA [Colletotrichum siamense]|uniref:Transcription factor steA n=1 Tax=Colletotrichum siamense TaxID=690259 RepID=UPI0018723095|nr:Transcription factor steA [Colletotrichum siamense]KAF5490048.1 Transcription factor steA [Colletotrichum siamense]